MICWKVDRFARDRRDDANLLFEIELADARLISATENIDHTPAGRLMHGMLATFAEYYSRNLANEVLKGLLLETRGLRSRGNRRYGPRPLDLKRVQEMLSNPHYTGIVSYRGKHYPGRHKALISQELFDRVQAVLVAHRHSGERDRKHQNALEGTIRCGICGSGLTYSRNKGNGGHYEYFVCPRNQRGECPQGYQRVDLVETPIEQHYATVGLSDTEREQVRRAIAEDLGERMTTARQEVERCQGVPEEVKVQERKLLHMHYEDRITGELFDDEQKRIKRERRAAETLIERLNLGYQDIETTLDLALEIICEDLHDLYLKADDTIRRLLNQAIFKALYVSDEEITRTELAEPFTQLHAIHSVVGRATANKPPARGKRTAKGPRPDRGQKPLDRWFD